MNVRVWLRRLGTEVKEWGRTRPLCPYTSDVDLLSNRKGVIDLNAKISDGTFNLGMP